MVNGPLANILAAGGCQWNLCQIAAEFSFLSAKMPL